MAADTLGNDIGAVGLPLTGFLAYGDSTVTALPTAVVGGATSFVLGTGWTKVGLLVEDGGFEWTLEPDGDPIKFWQDGYSIPSGLANASLVAKLAQTNEIVRKLVTGATADANHYLTIDAGGHSDVYPIFTEELFKNGYIRRRTGFATVDTVKEDKSERGSVLGYEVTFKINRSASLGNKHLGEWLLPPA